MRLGGRIVKLGDAALSLIICTQNRQHVRMVKLEIDVEAYRLLAHDTATGTICHQHATPRGEARLTRVLYVIQ